MYSSVPTSNVRQIWITAFCLLFVSVASVSARAQDWFKTQTSSGAQTIRLASSDFKPGSADPQAATLKRSFDTTLYSDLAAAGIFDMVSKSLAPQATPGTPAEIHLLQWSNAPVSAAMVAFGSFGVQADRIVVNGYLFDVRNQQYPQVLAQQYNEEATDDQARQIAHRFADEIILRLGGGTPGIAETKIYYVKMGGGNKEIWAMDYDGANQHAITQIGSISISPRVSPDNSRIAFSSLGKYGFQIRMYSLLLGRLINFNSTGGTNLSPAWAPDGNNIAYSSSRTGDPEIWTSDPSGNLSRRITSIRGPDVSPTFNPKTGAQIAWISGRTGLPQLYIMDADGSNMQRLTDIGYATSPSWSPNGQFVAFAWDRKYGPGAPGGQDIYVMQVTPGPGGVHNWIQLTHDIGRCDFPSWSPDGRHIVFANTPGGKASSTRVMTMLVDGTQQRALTGAGADMPNWSWR